MTHFKPLLRDAGAFVLGFTSAVILLGPAPRASAREMAEHQDKGPNSSHGKNAVAPTDIGPAGWREIVMRTYREVSRDRVMAVSAGVTFYGLLAMFPAMAAFVSLYGLVAAPDTVMEHLGLLGSILPAQAYSFIRDQMERIASAGSQDLGLSLVIGLALALWSANAGMKALFDALNVAYGEDEKRGFFRLNLVSMIFTVGVILFAVVAILLVVALPAVLDYVYLGNVAEPLFKFGRWPALMAVLIAVLAVLYRFGPSRENARWQWVSPGAVFAAVVWLVASVGLSWYMANFEDYDKTYGTVGAAIALMMWMWISAIIVTIGAELNAESERQTLVDTTTGAPLPIGTRGADAADRK